ncbi:hypothetical protein KM043_004602 [Ampulex compressa]|nr:hypothetical protein KM043_004602 [Ampulex compressa]
MVVALAPVSYYYLLLDSFLRIRFLHCPRNPAFRQAQEIFHGQRWVTPAPSLPARTVELVRVNKRDGILAMVHEEVVNMDRRRRLVYEIIEIRVGQLTSGRTPSVYATWKSSGALSHACLEVEWMAEFTMGFADKPVTNASSLLESDSAASIRSPVPPPRTPAASTFAPSVAGRDYGSCYASAKERLGRCDLSHPFNWDATK